MIEALKSDDVVNKVGGRFKLAALVQKRLVDVTFGAPLLVERGNMTLMEAVVQEVLQGKITLELRQRGAAAVEEPEALGGKDKDDDEET